MSLNLLLITVFALALGLFCAVTADKQLVYVTVLFRHGDRSPVKAYPTDPYQEDTWPQGFGQLSQEGMRQHFELGQFLRQRYKGFLNETYNRHQILVRSTDYDRTLMSAEANLAGLFPPNDKEMFRPGLEWQPIPVHTVPMTQERLLSFPLGDCPLYKQLINETEQSATFINMTNKYKDFIEMVKNKTGLKKTNVESIWSVYDTLYCESCHNLTAPDWVTPDVMDKLRILKDFGFQVMFEVYKQQEKCRLQGGVLLGEIVKNLSKMAVPDPKQKLKLMMLSAHDTTVVALQSSMFMFNSIQPPYAACHMFELHRDDNGSVSVSMFYRNDSSVAPYPVSLPSCGVECPLEDFIRITHDSIPVDRQKECQLPSMTRDTEVVIGLAVCGALLFLLILVLLILLCYQKEPIRSQGYRHMINQDAGDVSHS